MKKIQAFLMSADNLLDEISVRGNDVFVMVRARELLKTAYDAIGKLKNEEEVMEEDGR